LAVAADAAADATATAIARQRSFTIAGPVDVEAATTCDNISRLGISVTRVIWTAWTIMCVKSFPVAKNGR